MRTKLNMLAAALLITGLTVCARPAGRRVKRFCFRQAAARQWAACKNSPEPAQPGEPVAWMTLPGLISSPVLSGADKSSLSLSPCAETIGKATVIMAHRDTHFHNLKNARPGTPVHLELRNGKQKDYRLTDHLIVDADRAEQTLLDYSGEDRLILLTCYPFGYIGPAPSRILFFADPVIQPASSCPAAHLHAN